MTAQLSGQRPNDFIASSDLVADIRSCRSKRLLSAQLGRITVHAGSHTGVPRIGIADLFVGDRPTGTPVPRLGPREVRPKPHPKGSYSETITTSSPSISSAGTAP